MVERRKTGKALRKSPRRRSARRLAAQNPGDRKTSADLLRDVARLIARANALRAEYDMLQKDFLRADAELERSICARGPARPDDRRTPPAREGRPRFSG